MLNLFKPKIFVGPAPEPFDVSYQSFTIVNNGYIVKFDNDLYVENMWGEALPIFKNNSSYNFDFLDLSLTLSVTENELQFIENLFNDQTYFEIMLDQKKNNTDKPHSVVTTSQETRILKIEKISSDSIISKIRIRTLSTKNTLFSFIGDTEFIHFHLLWKSLYNYRLEFVLKTLFIYINLNKQKTITDKELNGVIRTIEQYKLFKKVDYKIFDDHVTFHLSTGETTFNYKLDI